jgi:two-component system OmpR family response regulator
MEKVLVVDDEADILKLISENLLVRGYHVSTAKNGTEALAQLHDSPPSLMVLDIKLPDITGWELLEKIKSDPLIESEFPVLIMTASIAETVVDLKRYPSVVEIIIKPFSAARLVSAVKLSLSRS